MFNSESGISNSDLCFSTLIVRLASDLPDSQKETSWSSELCIRGLELDSSSCKRASPYQAIPVTFQLCFELVLQRVQCSADIFPVHVHVLKDGLLYVVQHG